MSALLAIQHRRPRRVVKRSQTVLQLVVGVTTLLVNPVSSFAFAPSLPSHHRISASPSLLATVDETSSQAKSSSDDNNDSNNETSQWRRKDLFGTSLIEDTLQNLENDAEYQEISTRYAELGSQQISREERAIRRRALNSLGIPSFGSFLQQQNASIQRREPKLLQMNIGLYCNQACGHCHVESSPLRTESMSTETIVQCIKLLQSTPSIETLDITGGAPELNPNFRFLVTMARELFPDIEIIDRCNLTVLQEPGQEDLIEFLKANKVRVIASLPCYSAENVNKQRGRGVFDRSIAALLALNEAGYGVPGSNLLLDLVYNPLGTSLPPEQSQLEIQYKQQLKDNFGIEFNSLFTITNMPIKRFADMLHRNGEMKEYMDLLVRNFNVATTKNVMCVDLISIGYDGKVYDCDFNQQLGFTIERDLTVNHDADDENWQGDASCSLTVFDLDNYQLQDIPIRVDNHCFGCTAGSGSSCQGTTA